jgi:hypothetical protein
VGQKCLWCRSHIDIENDGFMNESVSLEEDEGEVRLKPMGIAD